MSDTPDNSWNSRTIRLFRKDKNHIIREAKADIKTGDDARSLVISSTSGFNTLVDWLDATYCSMFNTVLWKLCYNDLNSVINLDDKKVKDIIAYIYEYESIKTPSVKKFERELNKLLKKVGEKSRL